MRKLIDLDADVVSGIRLLNAESGVPVKLWVEKFVSDYIRGVPVASVERSVVEPDKDTADVSKPVKSAKTEKSVVGDKFSDRFNIWSAMDDVRGE